MISIGLDDAPVESVLTQELEVLFLREARCNDMLYILWYLLFRKPVLGNALACVQIVKKLVYGGDMLINNERDASLFAGKDLNREFF